MNREPDLYDQLEQASRERVNKAVRALLVDDDVKSADRHLAWAESAARAAQLGSKSIHPVYIAGLILLICLSLITLAWSLNISDNPVELRLQVKGVEFRADDQWDAMQDIPVSRIVGRGLTDVNNVPGLGDRPETDFDLSQINGRIQSLQISNGARVELDFEPGNISLSVWDGTLTGTIAVASAVLTLGHREKRVDINTVEGMPPTETIIIFGMQSDPQAKPIRLDIDTNSALQINDLLVTRISFVRENPPRSGKKESTVLNATGRISNVDRQITLRSGDWIKLEGMNRTRLSITREGRNRAEIELTTVVDSVFVGVTQTSIKDITPNWLEYLTKSQTLSVAWGALLLLWGLAWKFRGLF